MSRFQLDLSNEQMLAQKLDEIYDELGFQCVRIDNLEQQYQGIDIILKHDGINYAIDEKAQLHYLNKDLPTFTFELSYKNQNRDLRSGWLFDEHKLTEYYFLITGIEARTPITTSTDFKSLKITSVNRQKLIDLLESDCDLNESKLAKYDSELRSNRAFGKEPINELNASTEGALYHTEHLAEQPINIQLRLEFLIRSGVGKRIWPV